MSENQLIPKNPDTPPAGDYNRLREEGLRHIERLSSDVWTDYNVHDPGITLLELLCYALTDLEYRTSWPVEDLLSDGTAAGVDSEASFHTAREILTSNPVTLHDYRKLLIDIEGVRNAWLHPLEETRPELYVNLDKGAWEEEPGKSNRRLNLAGLYDVTLELGEDDRAGDLNEYLYELDIDAGTGGETDMERAMVRLPDWSAWLNLGVRAADMGDPQLGEIKPAEEDSRFTFRAEIRVDSGGRDMVREAEIELTHKDLPPGDVRSRLQEEQVMSRYGRKLKAALEIGEQALERLHESRNICEDFESFRALQVEEIGICADIEVENDAELERVLAAIYHEIGRHLAPSVNFYTLEEMLNRDVAPSEIFEGPALEHGFISDEELQEAEIRREIHLSDLLQIIMDVEGVQTVDNLMLNSAFRGESVAGNVRWEYRVAEGRMPRLSVARSDIDLFKEKLPYDVNPEKVRRYMDDLASLERSRKLRAGDDYDFPLPRGTDRRVADYTSVQADLPLNYGVGEAGIPGRVTEKRRAQSRQLQAYLMFYDQLLADYLAQLANLKNLYTFSNEVDRTYFYQALFEKPAGAGTEWDRVRFDPDGSPGGQVSSDPLAYLRRLDRESEDRQEWEDRRNRFLDHLLARFGESFTDYVMLMYTRGDGPRAAGELIDDKSEFLRDYPELSAGRGTAFNYREVAWETDNVSGFERRVCRLLGMDRYGRRSLQCPDPEEYFELYEDEGGRWRFRFSPGGEQVLRSPGGYANRDTCRNRVEAVKEAGRHLGSYERRETSGGAHDFVLRGADGEVLARGVSRDDAGERDRLLDSALDALSRSCGNEGFHLVEHILLRPERGGGPKLPVCAREEGRGCPGYADPYSFRISLVVPAGAGRFSDMPFRRFVEKTLRREAPAHIHLKICWVDHEDLASFEEAWKAWLQARAADRPEPGELEEKLEKLISVMRGIRSVYPPATLHDFREDRSDRPMLLDNSILG